MKIAVAQANPTVGALSANREKAISICNSLSPDVSLVVFPEMFLTGYPPEDLLLRSDFIDATAKEVKNLVRYSRSRPDLAILLGAPVREGEALYNACLWIQAGKVKGRYFKHLLPNYGVFDERRYFSPGENLALWDIGGVKVLPTICEDIWDLENGPLSQLDGARPDLVINTSASPFHKGKLRERLKVITKASRTARAPLLYVNLVGGQDELVFDGGSLLVSGSEVKFMLPRFREVVEEIDLEKVLKVKGRVDLPKTGIEEVYEALVLGVRDYVEKNGFKKTLVGLSGGIDSSLTCALLVDALGRDRVVGVSMPSRFNSPQTIRDVKRLVENLGVECHWIEIEPIFQAFLEALRPVFRDLPFDTAEENIQARIRGTLLMALSNKFGWLVITTGNKSEMSVGYATLYGDMAGGFALLKDVPKTMVWQLARYLNRRHKRAVIPESIIRRPPSAELRFNQRDEDSLVPYPVLDKIIDAYVEKRMGYKEIVELGIPESAVKKILRLIWRSEYKRRQAPPGVKITPLAFGKDWRMPITNQFSPVRE